MDNKQLPIPGLPAPAPKMGKIGGRLARLHRKARASTCEICGEGGELHTHHRDWNHFNDTPSNWLTVCQRCHNILHEVGYLTDQELETIIAKVRAERTAGEAAVNG